MNTVKTRFIKDVTDYFNIKDRTAKYYAENSQNKSYDNDLMTSINRMIDNGNK